MKNDTLIRKYYLSAMTSKELRVGNWVNDRASQPYQVTAENIAILASSEETGKINIDFNPVALTEDWLLKLGFVRPHENAMWYERDYVRLKIFLCFQDEGETDFLIQVQATDTGDAVEFMNAECKFVHQLQNAYPIFTGTELEIKWQGL